MATMGMTVGLTVAVMVHLCIVAMFNDQVMQRRSLHFQAELGAAAGLGSAGFLHRPAPSDPLSSPTISVRCVPCWNREMWLVQQNYIAGVDKAVAAAPPLRIPDNPL